MNESESKHKQVKNKAILSLDGLKYFITNIYWHPQTKVSKYHQISWSHLPHKELQKLTFLETPLKHKVWVSWHSMFLWLYATEYIKIIYNSIKLSSENTHYFTLQFAMAESGMPSICFKLKLQRSNRKRLFLSVVLIILMSWLFSWEGRREGRLLLRACSALINQTDLFSKNYFSK